MTGYGKCSVKLGERTITAEIKSLNSKAMDIFTKVCPLFREKDLEVRSRIAAQLERGKVDFMLSIEDPVGSTAQAINVELLEGYMAQIRQIAEKEQIDLPADWFQTLLRMPDVIGASKQEQLTDEQWDAASKAVDGAIKALMDFRTQEGIALERKFREKITNIGALLASVEQYEKGRTEKIKERLRDNLESVTPDYDRNRFEQEMIFYIEKLDISEEKQRLTNHLAYFISTIEEGHGQGKKLGFIAQEMGREINTLGSKSNQAEMQNIVVRMKDELEQIKEQVLNVM